MFQLCPCGHKTCGWQVKLCDPIKHEALLEHSEDLKCTIQVLLLHYIYYILHYITVLHFTFTLHYITSG